MVQDDLYKLITTNLIQSEAAWRTQGHTFREQIMTIKPIQAQMCNIDANYRLSALTLYPTIIVGMPHPPC